MVKPASISDTEMKFKAKLDKETGKYSVFVVAQDVGVPVSPHEKAETVVQICREKANELLVDGNVKQNGWKLSDKALNMYENRLKGEPRLCDTLRSQRFVQKEKGTPELGGKKKGGLELGQ